MCPALCTKPPKGGASAERLRERLDRVLVGEIDMRGGKALAGMGGGQRRHRLFRLGLGGAIGEGHVVPGRRERLDDRRAETASAAGHEDAPLGGGERHQAGSRAITSDTFWPPNPNELEMA